MFVQNFTLWYMGANSSYSLIRWALIFSVKLHQAHAWVLLSSWQTGHREKSPYQSAPLKSGHDNSNLKITDWLISCWEASTNSFWETLDSWIKLMFWSKIHILVFSKEQKCLSYAWFSNGGTQMPSLENMCTRERFTLLNTWNHVICQDHHPKAQIVCTTE